MHFRFSVCRSFYTCQQSLVWDHRTTISDFTIELWFSSQNIQSAQISRDESSRGENSWYLQAFRPQSVCASEHQVFHSIPKRHKLCGSWPVVSSSMDPQSNLYNICKVIRLHIFVTGNVKHRKLFSYWGCDDYLDEYGPLYHLFFGARDNNPA